MINIKDLNVSFSGKSILSKIDVLFERGKFCCIAGPNGSGKTTLLRSISRGIPLEKKLIYIQQEDITSLPQKKLSQMVGYVPQASWFDCDFTSFDVVMMGRNPYQHALQVDSFNDIRIVKESMTFTNTWHLRDLPFRVLSGGEMQRISIARALAQQTEILLLDEPVSNLDIHHQHEILHLLKKLNAEQGLTIIAVLHDLNHILNYAHEVILLNQGNIVAKGNPKDVLNRENIREVFSVEAHFIENPLGGSNILVTMGLEL